MRMLIPVCCVVVLLAAPAAAGQVRADYWSSFNGGPVGLWLTLDDSRYWLSLGAGAYYDEWVFGSQYTWSVEGGVVFNGWGVGYRRLTHVSYPGFARVKEGLVLRTPPIRLGDLRVQASWHGADWPGWTLRLSDPSDRIGFQVWWYTRPGGAWNHWIWAGPFVGVSVSFGQ